MTIRSALFLIAALIFSLPSLAFELKGFQTGVEVSTLDLKACAEVKNADSGLPGYSCKTTLGGDAADARVAVFGGKVVAVVFRIESGRLGPVRDALAEKYGRPSQSNRYIEDYDWSEGNQILGIKEQRVTKGYTVILMDRTLYAAAQKAAKEKAKGDL